MQGTLLELELLHMACVGRKELGLQLLLGYAQLLADVCPRVDLFRQIIPDQFLKRFIVHLAGLLQIDKAHKVLPVDQTLDLGQPSRGQSALHYPLVVVRRGSLVLLGQAVGYHEALSRRQSDRSALELGMEFDVVGTANTAQVGYSLVHASAVSSNVLLALGGDRGQLPAIQLHALDMGGGQNCRANHGTRAGQASGQWHIAVYSDTHPNGAPLAGQLFLDSLDAAQEVVVPSWAAALGQLDSGNLIIKIKIFNFQKHPPESFQVRIIALELGFLNIP